MSGEDLFRLTLVGHTFQEGSCRREYCVPDLELQSLVSIAV